MGSELFVMIQVPSVSVLLKDAGLKAFCFLRMCKASVQNIVLNYFEFITLSMSIHNLDIRIAVQFFSKL
jgi:hypothetical protein